MSSTEIKVKNKELKYSIFLGSNILSLLPKKIKLICPKAEKIGLVIDKQIPKKQKNNIKRLLKNYKVLTFEYSTNEKLKSFKHVNNLVEKCLLNNFKRSDVLISFGGGITGDFTAFVASIIKRGINFINIPSTLLAQVDSSIGGKTGVNSMYGKNLIGSFYQPCLVISDLTLLNSLPKREIICGYAEILKHAVINDVGFFSWLKKNSTKILEDRNLDALKYAIFKSCKIKSNIVEKDVKEKNIRMILNFGHTFAHAIEVKNNYSKRINHGEAVLMGMMIATKLSFLKKTCTLNTLRELEDIYSKNNLNYKFDKYFNFKDHDKIIRFMSNDKKNNSDKINLILLKKIGRTTKPGQHKFSTSQLRRVFNKII